MIDNNQLNQIAKKLNLEKISVIQKVEILCFPKKNDKEFKEKFKKVEKDVKKISKQIDLKIVEEGEIDNVKAIEFSAESGINGVKSS